jgi:tRNA(Ile)-lysidine synthase
MSQRRPSLDAATAAVRHAVRECLAALRPGRVLVGVSGGADSLALAAAVAHVAPRLGIGWGTLTVDHGLQAGSAAVAATAARRCAALGADPAAVERVRVTGSGGMEAAARRARLAALERARCAQGADLVLLAHTLDDQAETVLLGLARGSGPRAVGGMRPVAGRIVRPLLGLRRCVTRASCRARGIPVWDDPQNHDPRFARVRVRDRVLPLLERELGPGFAAALARTAALVGEDTALLDAMAAERAAGCAAGVLPVALVRDLPGPLATRTVKRVVEAALGRPQQRVHVEAVVRLATTWHGQGPIDLPGGRARRVGDEIRVAAATSPSRTRRARVGRVPAQPVTEEPPPHETRRHQGRSRRGPAHPRADPDPHPGARPGDRA